MRTEPKNKLPKRGLRRRVDGLAWNNYVHRSDSTVEKQVRGTSPSSRNAGESVARKTLFMVVTLTPPERRHSKKPILPTTDERSRAPPPSCRRQSDERRAGEPAPNQPQKWNRSPPLACVGERGTVTRSP